MMTEYGPGEAGGDSRERIRQALLQARVRAGCEISALAIPACSNYERGADMVGVFTALLASLAFLTSFPDAQVPLYWLLPAQLAAFLAGAVLLGRSETLRFILAGRAVMSHRVRQAALDCFRTLGYGEAGRPSGVLIYCALFERQVVVLADPALHQRVDPRLWREIRDRLLEGLRSGDPGAGWIQALAVCERIGQTAGPQTALHPAPGPSPTQPSPSAGP